MLKYNKYRNCPICKKKKNNIYFQQKKPNLLRFVICNNCDFIFQNPYINFNHKKFYKKKVYFGAIDLKNKFLIKRFEDVENQIKKKNKNISILDYGCGNGSFLHFLKKKNYKNLYGYELNLEKTSKTNIVFYDSIKKINKKFDLITLNHVLEHVVNPVKKLKFLSNMLLKNSGKLIIEVPNSSVYESFGIKPGNYVKEHFNQFTIKSLYNCAIQANLSFEMAVFFDGKNRDPFIPSLLIILSKNKNLINSFKFFKNKINEKKLHIKQKLKKLAKYKISIFGCGDGLDYLINFIKPNQLQYFFDSNKKIIGSKINGKTIRDPKFIKFLDNKNLIIITSLSIYNSKIIREKIKLLNPKLKIISL